MAYTLKRINLADAAVQFPGCDTEDLKETYDQNQVEEDYCTLGITDDGRLLCSTYEIAYIGWSVWNAQDKVWQDLNDADYNLWYKLHTTHTIEFV